jgi:hypothetical protein
MFRVVHHFGEISTEPTVIVVSQKLCSFVVHM